MKLLVSCNYAFHCLHPSEHGHNTTRIKCQNIPSKSVVREMSMKSIMENESSRWVLSAHPVYGSSFLCNSLLQCPKKLLDFRQNRNKTKPWVNLSSSSGWNTHMYMYMIKTINYLFSWSFTSTTNIYTIHMYKNLIKMIEHYRKAER